MLDILWTLLIIPSMGVRMRSCTSLEKRIAADASTMETKIVLMIDKIELSSESAIILHKE